MPTETVTTKTAAKSKVIWFNGLVIIASVAGLVPVMLEKLPFVAPEKAASIAAAAAVVVSGVNMVLRFFTDRPVTLRDGETKTLKRD